MIKRYDIAPDLVQAQIAKKVAAYETQRVSSKAEAEKTLAAYEASSTKHLWSRVPEGPGYVDPMIDASIAREQTHYAHVRVLERSDRDDKAFYLAYGQTSDVVESCCTGGFASMLEAQAWFLDGGR